MPRKLSIAICLATLLVIPWALLAQEQEDPQRIAKGAGAALLERLEGTDSSASSAVLVEVLSGGAALVFEALADVIDRTELSSDEKRRQWEMARDADARRALHGLVIVAAAPGNSAAAERLAGVLAIAASIDRPEGVRRFLARQLGRLGHPAGVPPLAAAVIAGEAWSDEAIRSLGMIPGDRACDALLGLLAEGPSTWRPLVATALAQRGEPQTVAGLLIAARESDALTRAAAIDSLVALGAPEVIGLLQDQITGSSDSNRPRWIARAIELAARLESSMEEGAAEEFLESLLASGDLTPKQFVVAERLQARCRQWKPLFDGKSLAGWVGAVEGYTVEDGELRLEEGRGGNLFSAGEYADFVFRFEFKLWPGSNNGLGLRAPLDGNSAYEGLEAQIIDNSAEKYASLKPYQLHGSIYGVVPAIRGYLKPVGEWNRQQVSLEGKRVTITLNGTVILDADLDQASAGGTVDGQDHPGLKNTSGHIGFLGHGDPIAFRNIRLREIKP